MAQFYDPIRDAWIDTDTGRELGQNETSLNVGATSTASISYQQFNEQHEAAGTDAKVNAYLADYVAKMRALGYDVEISGDTTADSLMYNLPPVYEVTVTKNGVSVGSVISEGQIQAWPNPADKASFDWRSVNVCSADHCSHQPADQRAWSGLYRPCVNTANVNRSGSAATGRNNGCHWLSDRIRTDLHL